jgi:hypothetical protein
VPHTPGWVWAGPFSCIGKKEKWHGRPAGDGEDGRGGAEPAAAAAAAPRSRRRRGQRRMRQSKPVYLGWGVQVLGLGGARRHQSRVRVWGGGPVNSPELERAEGLLGGRGAVEDRWR